MLLVFVSEANKMKLLKLFIIVGMNSRVGGKNTKQSKEGNNEHCV